MKKDTISGVYLLKCPYKGINMLKIGCSKNVLKRIATHKSSNPLIEVLGVIISEDWFNLEREIHLKCKAYRFRLEWFYFNEKILDYFKTFERFVIFI